jgi:hypothetical protein
MQDPIKLAAKDLPSWLKGFNGYRGRKYKTEARTSVTIPMDAGLWSGGSRTEYFIVRMEDGALHRPPMQDRYMDGRKDIPVQLEPGFCVVVHSIFCGKDCGLTVYVHPDNLPKLLGQAK